MRKYKHHILYIVVINILSLICINNISALSYESSVGIGFTFNPTLSVSLSSSGLVISNLTPGSTANSNSINVSVATNAAYGYTLSVNASSENLIHNNNTNTFSSIAIDADLASLTTDNTWGYNTSLDNGNSWSNYNGLSSSSTTLLDANINNTVNGIDTIDFKIGAKAGSTQPSGTYTNTINFIAISKVAPMSLLDSFIASGAEQLNGYFKMQDMTHDICNNVDIEESELQLIDVRDNKVYWVAKLKDGNCWMTQNLDLDLDSTRTYTHWDTDLGWSENNINENTTWQPMRSTINFIIGSAISGWQSSTTEPYSASPGNVYFYTSNSNTNDTRYNTLQDCIASGHNDCTHYHAGNYYNWLAAMAINSTEEIPDNALNSICPKGWALPSQNIYTTMLTAQNIYNVSSNTYADGWFNKLRAQPLYFTRPGRILYGSTNSLCTDGFYWQNSQVDRFWFYNSRIFIGGGVARDQGFSVRCVIK